jgi:transposase
MDTIEFPQLIERGCGLDVHRDTVVATVSGKDLVEHTLTFATHTQDLENLIGWLQNQGVTHVAMESTGVYWKPVYSVLEGYFELLVVNARHIKNVPGHKTDKKDSEWIVKLLLSGLLKPSFVPREEMRFMRVLFRHRKKLINQRSRAKNRLQNILQDANIKLSSVVSDVFSKTGMAIIEKLLEGVTDPVVLANQAKGSLVNKKEELQLALYGRFTEHHRYMVRFILDTIESHNQSIAKLEAELQQAMNPFHTELNLLQTIPGISQMSAIGILAEIGPDMDKFRSDKHLASWAGVCPGNNESAGKKMSSRVTQGNNYLKTTLIEASWACSHTMSTYLSFKYWKLAQRRGKKKAAMAIGHEILKAAFYILRDKTSYKEPQLRQEIIEERRKAEMDRLEKRLQKLKTLASN